MILILTEPLDPHADYVEKKLCERGADFVRLDYAQFPSKAEISLLYSVTGQVWYTLRAGKESIDLSDLKAVWYRRPKLPIPHDEINNDLIRDYVEEECKTFLNDTWNSLDCLWLPAPQPVIQRAQFKASQLKIAGALGFELPPTLFTNSPKDFLDFYRHHDGNIVSKLAGVSFLRFAGKIFCRYTEAVSKRDVGYAQAIRYCPVIFQAYVPKRVELRITIVGQEVFAAEIHSQESNHTRHDWRRYDHYETPYLPHELPQDVAQRCVQLVEQLGLCYGAIDMVLTPDGRYVFLEINPNGQYLWIEYATGLPISDAICDLLMSGTRLTNPAVPAV
jgi:glutathione synthase/RimK-type ligase-like ATP-grasp enzyme